MNLTKRSSETTGMLQVHITVVIPMSKFVKCHKKIMNLSKISLLMRSRIQNLQKRMFYKRKKTSTSSSLGRDRSKKKHLNKIMLLLIESWKQKSSRSPEMNEVINDIKIKIKTVLLKY